MRENYEKKYLLEIFGKMFLRKKCILPRWTQVETKPEYTYNY